MTAELRYAEGTADIETLRAVTAAVWAELRQDGESRRELLAIAPPLREIVDDCECPYEISPGSSGFDINGTALLISVGAWAANVASGVAQELILDAWRKVILPRIRDRLGSDAVGREEDEDKKQG